MGSGERAGKRASFNGAVERNRGGVIGERTQLACWLRPAATKFKPSQI